MILKQGEKLFEELLVDSHADVTIHPRIMSEKIGEVQEKKLMEDLKKLQKACINHDIKTLLNTFEKSKIGFSHKLNKDNILTN